MCILVYISKHNERENKMFTINQDVNVVDSHTNETETFQVIAVTENKVTIMGWDFQADFIRKQESFWNGDFYIEAA